MKKLVVFSVVFALIAGAAFAQPSLGGGMDFQYMFLSGDSGDGSFINSGGLDIHNAHVNANWGDAQAGGMVRLFTKTTSLSWSPDAFTFIWWKPIEQLRFQLGQNADGDWGHAQIAGWGFNAEGQQIAALDQDRGLNNFYANAARQQAGISYGALGLWGGPGAWAPGFGARGATLQLTPVDGLSINAGIPVDKGTAGNTFSHLYLNANYTIQDIGTIRVSTQLAPGKNDGDADKWYGAGGTSEAASVWGSFYLMAIDGMGLDVGFGMKLPMEGVDDPPMNLGLGFRYTAGALTFKLRAGASLGGDNNDTIFGINVLPSYNINENLVGYLNVGFGMCTPDGDGDSLSDWYVNPYVMVRAGGSLRFYAGFQLSQESGEDTPVKWGLPVGMRAYF